MLHNKMTMLDSGSTSIVFQYYMHLCLLEKKNADPSHVRSLACKIVKSAEGETEPAIDPIVAHCSQILKANHAEDDVLVPERFGLIGISPLMTRLRDRIDRFAHSANPVLIRGESGTGKELTARALHDASERVDSPFVPVNCAAIPEGVFESQLFGHVAGAFTGAAKDQPGLIEIAGEGTLFLDEVGELPLAVQAKMLRFLESGEYRRLGSDRILRSRARVLAATHRPLAGVDGFRQDLFHRLKRLEIELPTLDSRPEDIRYLARHRVSWLNREDGRHWKRLSRDAETALGELHYAGNVRELFNIVDHAWHEAVQEIGPDAIQAARSKTLEEPGAAGANDPSHEVHWMEHDGPSAASAVNVRFSGSDGFRLDFDAPTHSLRLVQERAACSAIRQALDHFDGDATRVAQFLDISRRSVYRYLARERVDAESDSTRND